jgi:2'-5' RNA ligase
VTAPRARRRLFVALEITGKVAAEIDGLRRAIGSSSLGRIAPHLTLVPPVNVPESELAGALGLLRSVAYEAPIPVSLGPAGSFSSRSPVLYLAVDDPSGRIARLQRRLDAAPLVAPKTRPNRPFSAHVTLSNRMDHREKSAATELFVNFKLETVLSALTLYEQQHDEPRHPWYPLADVLLGTGTPPGRGGRQLGFVVARTPGPDVTPNGDTRRVDGGEPLAVIGREDGEVVAEARGAIVGAQLEIESWGVEASRRGEGIGRALVLAIERASAGLGAERLIIASSSDAQAAFLDHIGYAPVGRLPASGASMWSAPRRDPLGATERS